MLSADDAFNDLFRFHSENISQIVSNIMVQISNKVNITNFNIYDDFLAYMCTKVA